jgi:hypothetical protein
MSSRWSDSCALASIAEIHRALRARDVTLAKRTVTNLVHRHEALLTLQAADPFRLAGPLNRRQQQRVVVAIDGAQVDLQHEVLWVLRDVLSGTVLVARHLMGPRESDLATLLGEVAAALPVPLAAVLSAGQPTIRRTVQTALPGVPHYLYRMSSTEWQREVTQDDREGIHASAGTVRRGTPW